MDISSISGAPGGLGSIGRGTGALGSSQGAGNAEGGEAFGGLLASLTGAQQSADQAMADVALGSDRDLADAVLSVQMESMQFDLAVQIRNRLVDTYQELFRMAV